MRGIAKDIWTDDRVKVVSGKYAGKTGIVTRRIPVKARLASYVWVRFDAERAPGTLGPIPSVGPKIHVRDVIVIELGRGHIARRRFEARRATESRENSSPGHSKESDSQVHDSDGDG